MSHAKCQISRRPQAAGPDLVFVACRLVPASCCLLVLLLSCGKQKESPQAVAPVVAPTPPGEKITASIQPSATDLTQNETYTAAFTLKNPTDAPVTVSRVVTNAGVIGQNSPDWRHGVIPPGQSATVAQSSGRATQPGVLTLSATFITDRGSFDAPPVKLTVTNPPPGAQGRGSQLGESAAGRVYAQLAAAPNPAQPGQLVTVNYDLVDSSEYNVTITNVEFDSAFPLVPGNPNWLYGQVPAHSTRTVARRSFVAGPGGSYTLTGRLMTAGGGVVAASPVTLTIAAPQPVDTGHVTAQIVVNPNPAAVGGTYTIEYRVVNTTLKDVDVTSIATDFGQIDGTSTEWQTGTAPAGATTVIARVAGEGAAVTSRRKTAVFHASAGDIVAPQVLLIIQ